MNYPWWHLWPNIDKYWWKFICDETYKHAFVLNALIVLLYSCLDVWETDQYLHFTLIVVHPLTIPLPVLSLSLSPCFLFVFLTRRWLGRCGHNCFVCDTVGECYTYVHNYFVCDHSSYISLWKLYLCVCIVFIFMIAVRPVEPCTFYICFKYMYTDISNKMYMSKWLKIC